ncbi:hypothetical protein SAMN04488107_2564 [Geodermatophilus saharensis]|uniref:Lipoprotein n=1 Tax=Geodermatophilus saharensis TaxID=1137994 RepID=A0A239EI69_9ACTN|nr:hypothetical protein [Geodermatophilus saharensis]SNS43968.1 hypothetical protein SAMN04488107_2564 [Geodermatophilus saharensis]
MRLTAAAVALGTTLLTGCGSADAEAPSTSLPSATSAAPTTEALPVVGPADFPVLPEARTQDAAGAEAFLRYWIDLLNRQRAIPAGQPLRDLGPDCGECQRIAGAYDETAAAGERYEGGELELNDVTTPRLAEDTAAFGFGVRQEAVRLVDATGAVVDPGQELKTNAAGGIDLLWSASDRTWLVTSFGIG